MFELELARVINADRDRTAARAGRRMAEMLPRGGRINRRERGARRR